jgi:CBS domain-containing protein
LTVAPDTTVRDLLAVLVTRNIGAMVVVDSTGPVGIVSERDVVRTLHEFGVELLGRPVSQIMTAEVITCTPTDTVDTLSVLMTTNRVRHVPVIAKGQLAGIVSIGDVVKTRMEELEAQQEQLEAYITQG